FPQCSDGGEDCCVEREEEGVRKAPACTDPVGHLYVDLILLQDDGPILVTVPGRPGGCIPQCRAYVLDRRCHGTEVFLEDQRCSITSVWRGKPRVAFGPVGSQSVLQDRLPELV